MIDAFDLPRFETALPRTAAGAALWTALGVRSAEYCYLIAVKPGIAIYVRSSLGPNGLCAESGNDSIRCWLALDETGAPLGSKNERWISQRPQRLGHASTAGTVAARQQAPSVPSLRRHDARAQGQESGAERRAVLPVLPQVRKVRRMAHRRQEAGIQGDEKCLTKTKT